MGLLDNLDDPKKLMLLQMGLGLLGGAPQGRKNFGADLAHAGQQGLMGYMQGREMQDRRAKEMEASEMRKLQAEQARMQLEEQRRAMAQRGQIADLAQRAFAPPQQLDPRQQEGGQQSIPGGGGMQAFAQGMMGIDPMQALQFMPKPRGPMALPKDSRLVDESGNVLMDALPDQPRMPEVGKVREIYKGGNVIQQAWNGQKWEDVGQGPRFKPEAPEKPPAPQLYEGPNGPMWITPPNRGSGVMPVTGADGQPLGPKKGEKPLTETQAKATLYTGMMQSAEDAISRIKIDPTTLKNQTDIALARGDIPKLPKSLQNVSASQEAQQYAQGTFQWTEAMLRQLTGAAAPEGEVWRQVKTYWPQPGDGPAVVSQKAAMRKQVGEYVRIVAAGGAAKADAATAPQASGAPQPGAEEGGYVFMGGDPSKPENWRKK